LIVVLYRTIAGTVGIDVSGGANGTGNPPAGTSTAGYAKLFQI
jgi:hypothetical protein